MSGRLDPPWRVAGNADAYWVESASGRRFGFCYFRDRLPIGSGDEAYQTREEARRLAHAIARLLPARRGQP